MSMDMKAIKSAAEELRPILVRMINNPSKEIAYVLTGREEVFARYQPIFATENIVDITEDQFKSFLLLKNNHHWGGLQRFGNFMTADMDKLRGALTTLLDESRPIKDRLNELLPNHVALVPRLGRATLTPILLIAYPNKYGVINNPANAALKKIGMWPNLNRNTPFGDRYEKVNELLVALAEELKTDLWTLDTLWWRVLEVPTSEGEDTLQPGEDIDDEGLESQLFGLERYLQEFIRDNWDKIKEFKEWSLHEEDGDIVGFEYNTGEIGRIDLLAHHKTEPRWLVIELKRNQTSDQTIGQVLRYMGWVNKTLAHSKEKVDGLIICKSSDANLQYALLNTNNVNLLLYDVSFQLRAVK